MLFDANGHINVTLVDGTTYVGLYAADGSWNVYDASGSSTPVGRYHASGALNVVQVDGSTVVGLYHPNGAINAVNASEFTGLYHPCGAYNFEGLLNAAEQLLAEEDAGLAIVFTEPVAVVKEL